jgi:hypothetical protein
MVLHGILYIGSCVIGSSPQGLELDMKWLMRWIVLVLGSLFMVALDA